MKTTVLDSYAVISYLQRQSGHEEIAKIFEECVTKDREVLLSVVNWGEVIYTALRTGGEQKVRLAEDVMRALPLQIIDADKDLTRQAALLKANNRMSYADCFAAALTMKRKCELVTGDKEFRQIEKSIKIRWI
jgi:predicted nucleic acid-binding protein